MPHTASSAIHKSGVTRNRITSKGNALPMFPHRVRGRELNQAQYCFQASDSNPTHLRGTWKFWLRCTTKALLLPETGICLIKGQVPHRPQTCRPPPLLLPAPQPQIVPRPWPPAVRCKFETELTFKVKQKMKCEPLMYM